MDIKAIFDFLEALKANNNRDWFEANKARFKECRLVFEDLVGQVIEHLAQTDERFQDVKPKDCIFRIYRDVRFSKDKTPYKTSFSACIAEGGRKSSKAIRYLHLEPGNTMLAGGMYRPEADQLKKIRQEIDYNAAPLKAVLADKGFMKYFDGMNGEQLKRPPKGYDAEHPDIDLLRFKSFTVFYKMADKDVLGMGFMKKGMEVFEAITPFNAYLDEATAE